MARSPDLQRAPDPRILAGDVHPPFHQGARLGKGAQFTVTVVTEQEPSLALRLADHLGMSASDR